ncbi:MULTISPECIES: SLC13 family permease [Prauserella salsuginis group]|uniref:Sodium-dependent dicarboxylate transporter SdcS n=1 Tax=Prauserella salsuginis TaxID=387889 RepID=A0ABW6G8N6_9PSEU|nr:MULTISPECIES: DASS family sodium-coupled anion symporter [Prauserella salsuginis group]MCR3722607.1 solute carrier family 13 (sodium-dependent dicarboxylate transporter), member 2/3/5 [Prauserella flava]MCR3737049.1 solute carrier family 13 (sodium-dependent dicarboxylate transporter), member 2/3/5 [Prauserella salsuginis]
MSQTGSESGTTVGEADADGANTRRWIGLGLGPVLAALLYVLLPNSLSADGKAAAAIAVVMATWWVTEAIPLAATALLPLVLFPLFGVAEIGDVTAPYASDIIFLFMGGFIIGLAMQRWDLHKRFALRTVLLVGTSPVRLIAGFMIATAFLSMWVSNTATAVMMLPVGVSVLGLVLQLGSGKGDPNFATALMLGIAYAASIGSLSTIIGTPPNAVLVGYLGEQGISIGFGQWMLFGLPIAIVFLFLAWLILAKVVYRPKFRELPGGRDLIRQQLDELGPMSRGEKNALAVFVGAAAAWIILPLLADEEIMGDAALTWLEYADDSVIAMIASVVLFILPVRRGVRTMNWDTAKQLPWGILLLFGGGLALSKQFEETGFATWLGDQVANLDVLPTILFVAAAVVIVLFMTELTSNTAMASIFVPILGAVAVGLGMDVMLLVVPAALAATCAFMLPVATPPNAIVFGSGHVTIGQMIKGGVWLNVIGIVLVTLGTYTLGAWILGIGL